MISTMSQNNRNRLKNTTIRTAAVLFWVAVWYVLALIVAKPLLLPTPVAVLTCLLRLIGTAEFWKATAYSLVRVFLGILCATLAGILLAALSVRFKIADNLLTPLLTVIKSTPVASFIILVLLWIGRDFVPVLITFLIVVPVVWANICTGLRAADRSLLEVSRVFRLTRLEILRHNYIPACKPHLFSALRSSVGLGWKAGIAAEVLTVPGFSIGRRLYESKLYLETEELFAWTLTVVLLSLLFETLTLWFLNRTSRHESGVTAS